MDLTHRFTVPTGVEETWAHFQDVASVAECFPGAQVTSAEGDTFQGSCKVKLGPIALVYNGSGTFVEKDEAAHRFVVDAKGKDKRGNGTAGAKVTLSMQASGTGTDVEVLTDLAITGKPAQFGRGVMQDVSDKLLGQFVDCLEERLTGGSAPEAAAAETPPLGGRVDADRRRGGCGRLGTDTVTTGSCAVAPGRRTPPPRRGGRRAQPRGDGAADPAEELLEAGSVRGRGPAPGVVDRPTGAVTETSPVLARLGSTSGTRGPSLPT